MATSISAASDAEFLDIMDSVKNALSAHPADYTMIPTELKTLLDDQRDAFGDSLPVHETAQTEARAKRLVKDADRDNGETTVRKIRSLAKVGGCTEAQIAALGVPMPSAEAPSTATRPIAMVDTSERLRHTISWMDEATPENKRKPRGVMGAEIWCKIDGPPPGDEKDCVYLALDSKTPYLVEHDPANAGKTAYYMLRWLYRDGSHTAWSETLSATITG